MPILIGAVKAAYESAYEQDPLRKYEDPKNLGHGGALIDLVEYLEMQDAFSRKPWKDRFSHRPCHDAESVFWVIVAFLLRAQPIDDHEEHKGGAEDADDGKKAEHQGEVDGGESQEDEGEQEDSDANADGHENDEEEEEREEEEENGDDDENSDGVGDDENSGDDDGEDDSEKQQKVKETKHEDKLEATGQNLDSIWRLLAKHTVQNGGVDGRGAVFNLKVADWKAALHAKLSFLASMLFSLSM
jgi:hypothetical protein